MELRLTCSVLFLSLAACHGESVGAEPSDAASDSSAPFDSPFDSTLDSPLDSSVDDSFIDDTRFLEDVPDDFFFEDVDTGVTRIDTGPPVDGAVDSGVCGVHEGPRMVQLPAAGGAFCIDTTEVTNAQYQRFIDDTRDTSHLPTIPPYCGWAGTVFAPPSGSADLTHPTRPVVDIDFCDATVYCLWAGKHLCGKIGGGHVAPMSSFSDPNVSQWDFACRGGSPGTLYPYGASYVGSKCAVAGPEGIGSLQDVGSFGGCRGPSSPYDQIVDLSGNAGEWDDSCDTYDTTATAPDKILCQVRGGYVGNSDGPFAFSCSADHPTWMTAHYEVTGFRCCK